MTVIAFRPSESRTCFCTNACEHPCGFRTGTTLDPCAEKHHQPCGPLPVERQAA